VRGAETGLHPGLAASLTTDAVPKHKRLLSCASGQSQEKIHFGGGRASIISRYAVDRAAAIAMDDGD
jgi:hypothetical protein